MRVVLGWRIESIVDVDESFLDAVDREYCYSYLQVQLGCFGSQL
jgi:hypothetical protein